MTKYKPEKYNLSDDQSCAADEPQWSKFGGFLTLWPDTYNFDFLQELFSLKFAFFIFLIFFPQCVNSRDQVPIHEKQGLSIEDI